MTFVLDASAALEAVLDDETGAVGLTVLERLEQEDAIVPAVWIPEIVNALVSTIRRDRIDRDGARDVLGALAECRIAVVTSGADPVELLEVAHAFGLSAYDASYLALAAERRLELATCDRALRAAARRAGVACL